MGARTWKTFGVAGGHPKQVMRGVLAMGVCAGLLAACSSGQTPSATTTSMTRPGTGVLTVKKGPPLTPAQASNLVTDGCLAFPGAAANVALAAAAFHSHGNSMFQILTQGPWNKVVYIGGIQDQHKYRRIAADARSLDRATVTGINIDKLEPVTGALNRRKGDCIALHRGVAG